MPRLDLEVDDDLGEEEEAGGRAGQDGDESTRDGALADTFRYLCEGVERTKGRHGWYGWLLVEEVVRFERCKRQTSDLRRF